MEYIFYPNLNNNISSIFAQHFLIEQTKIMTIKTRSEFSAILIIQIIMPLYMNGMNKWMDSWMFGWLAGWMAGWMIVLDQFYIIFPR